MSTDTIKFRQANPWLETSHDEPRGEYEGARDAAASPLLHVLYLRGELQREMRGL